MAKRKLLGEIVFNTVEELNNSNLSELLAEFSGKRDVDAEIEVTSAFLMANSDVFVPLSDLLYDLCFKVRSLRKYRYEESVSITFEDKLLFVGKDCIDSKRQFLVVRFYYATRSEQTDRLPVRIIADSDADSVVRKNLFDVVISSSCYTCVGADELNDYRYSPLQFALLGFCILGSIYLLARFFHS